MEQEAMRKMTKTSEGKLRSLISESLASGLSIGAPDIHCEKGFVTAPVAACHGAAFWGRTHLIRRWITRAGPTHAAIHEYLA